MNININIRADSADDYKAAIKALMDGAGMVGFEIPNLTLPAPRSGSVKAQQQAPVESPVPRAEELPIEATKAAQTPTAADLNRVVEDWTPGGGKQAEDVPAVTIDEVQALGRKMALAGKMDRVAAVLKKYDAPKITALPAETWAAVKADLEAANNE